MKAHPGYKWCGSSKQNMKPSSPTVTTRTKLPLTPPSDGGGHRVGSGDQAEKATGNCKSHMGITLGKLAGEILRTWYIGVVMSYDSSHYFQKLI